MEETPKNNPEQPAQLTPEMQSLANMAGKMGEKTDVGEKYYERAKEERNRWVNEAQKKLEEATDLKIEM